MLRLFEKLQDHALNNPEGIAVRDGQQQISWAQMPFAISEAITVLIILDTRVLALALDNCIDWVIYDLAAQFSGICTIPIPAFFSDQQVSHVLKQAGVDTILTQNESPGSFVAHGYKTTSEASRTGVFLKAIEPATTTPAKGVTKVTFTSGTTGEPKGVMLTASQQINVAQSVGSINDHLDLASHLCVLPLSVLLENIGGVYIPLMQGITTILCPMSELGFAGSSLADPEMFVKKIKSESPGSLILVPELLKLITALAANGLTPPRSLKFVAVGGARVSTSLLQMAAKLNIPVFEGYGLSELASVVAINQPGHNRPGSVGKLLPHNEYKFDDDGQLFLRGNVSPKYLNGDHTVSSDGWYATGDLAYVEDDYLYITGRVKNQIISSFGRNISPEWVEGELLAQPEISQACVFGEARPYLVALIVPSDPGLTDGGIDVAVHRVNRIFPDYARIRRWDRPSEPFSLQNKQAGNTGKPRRAEVYNQYQQTINSLYSLKKAIA